ARRPRGRTVVLARVELAARVVAAAEVAVAVVVADLATPGLLVVDHPRGEHRRPCPFEHRESAMRLEGGSDHDFPRRLVAVEVVPDLGVAALGSAVSDVDAELRHVSDVPYDLDLLLVDIRAPVIGVAPRDAGMEGR